MIFVYAPSAQEAKEDQFDQLVGIPHPTRTSLAGYVLAKLCTLPAVANLNIHPEILVLYTISLAT
jgi:hypothetical protein